VTIEELVGPGDPICSQCDRLMSEHSDIERRKCVADFVGAYLAKKELAGSTSPRRYKIEMLKLGGCDLETRKQTLEDAAGVCEMLRCSGGEQYASTIPFNLALECAARRLRLSSPAASKPQDAGKGE
jgi:hypothetical protein